MGGAGRSGSRADATTRAPQPEYDALDVRRAYGIFGGLPGHLALLRSEDDLATNVARLMIDPGGRLADEAEHVLDAFVSDAVAREIAAETVLGFTAADVLEH